MKRIFVSLSALMVCTILVFTAGCADSDTSETEEQEITTVEIGDLSLDVSAVGNLALAEKESLSFELAGTVSDILVEEGDSVEEGQILAKLDTSERQEVLDELEDVIEEKADALENADQALETAEEELTELEAPSYIEEKTIQAELAVTNAEISLANAEDAYDEAEADYISNWTVPEYIRTYEQKTAQLRLAELDLEDAEKTLNELSDTLAKEKADKEKIIKTLQDKLEKAQKDYDEAIEDYSDAEAQSYEITTPFNGYITSVKVEEGDDVQVGTNIMEIADPDVFEVEVFVSEVDISNIQVGSTATITLDADQSVILPAEVTYISPSATISSGVVNYAVLVQIKSTEMTALQQPQQMSDGFQNSLDDLEEGELPAMLQQAVDDGRMTQEEAEEMLETMQSGGIPGSQDDNGERPSMPDDMQGEMPSMPEGMEGEMPDFDGMMPGFSNEETVTLDYSSDGSIQLREGLTAAVDIVTETRTGVLLVPSTAISTVNGQSVVTVINDDGTEEERIIETGLSDWQNTEVISGLTEGEQVYVPVGTATSTESNNDGFEGPSGGGTMIIPGMGR